jgi:beta-glucosidase
VLPFQDPDRPVAERVGDLLGRLTPDERLALLHQNGAAVPRLGLAAFHTGQEVLHGVAWIGEATVFPQAVGLGATWDPALLRAVGTAVGREVRAMRLGDPSIGLNVWAPVVNPLRDPRWGRNEEGYAEDPLLTATLATAYCRGLRGDDPARWRTVPTLKHFLAYNTEADRTTMSVDLRARVLREYELPAFLGPLAAGVAGAVMPAYNLVNGRPNHLSPLFDEVLRAVAGDDLVICSDAWAPGTIAGEEHYYHDQPSAHAAALRAGLDSFTDHDTDPTFTLTALRAALATGLITRADVDRAARRLLTLRLRTGEFDGDRDPHATIPATAHLHPDHRTLARTAAREAIVLLRNDTHLLPLTDIHRIAVVGPLATTVMEDWYSGTLPYRISVADALVERLGREVAVADDGADLVTLSGREGTWRRADWGDEVVTFQHGETGRFLSKTEEGSLEATAERPGGWVVRETFHADDLHPSVISRGADRVAALARDADAVVVVLGNDPHINGRETQDRSGLGLPDAQVALVEAALAANPRTVLVLVSSYPYALDGAAGRVAAVVWSCHGGQEGGRALADVLTGAYNPGGRLPQTWYRSADELPDQRDGRGYDIIKQRGTYLYYDGEPAFAFGHGLSYTSFRYGPLATVDTSGREPTVPAVPAVPADATLTVAVDVTNTGDRDGDEVVQLYATAVAVRPEWLPLPHRALHAFRRVRLAAGETRRVELPVEVARLAYWDVARDRPRVAPGRYRLAVGPSSVDLRASLEITVTGEPAPPRRVVGVPVRAAAFDDHDGVRLVDENRERGDAIAVGEGTVGEVVFRDCDFGPTDGRAGSRRCHLRVAGTAERPPTASVQILIDNVVVGQAALPAGLPRYGWRDLAVDVTPVGGVHEVRLRAAGPVRLVAFSFSDGEP